MSRDVWMTFAVHCASQGELLQEILLGGLGEKLLYYKKNTLISSQDALAILVRGLAYLAKNPIGKGPFDIDQAPRIVVQAEGTNFTLFVRQELNTFVIMFDISSSVWYKNNNAQEGRGYVDWERYMLLMFALCKKFPITRIKTYDSYYDEDMEDYSNK